MLCLFDVFCCFQQFSTFLYGRLVHYIFICKKTAKLAVKQSQNIHNIDARTRDCAGTRPFGRPTRPTTTNAGPTSATETIRASGRGFVIKKTFLRKFLKIYVTFTQLTKNISVTLMRVT